MLEIERNLSADDESCNTLNFSQALWKRSQGQGNVRNHSIFLSESENGYYSRMIFSRKFCKGIKPDQSGDQSWSGSHEIKKKKNIYQKRKAKHFVSKI